MLRFGFSIAVRALTGLAILALLVSAWGVYRWHGHVFPSFLTIPNGEVGAIFHPSWSETQNLRYHDRITALESRDGQARFQVERGSRRWTLSAPLRHLEGREFGSIAVFPWLCAFLYLLLGWILYRYHLGLPSRELLFSFNLCIAIYLALVFDFHSTHLFDSLFLFTFVALGILIYQLAYLFPAALEENPRNRQYRLFWLILGLALATPYCFFYFRKDASWSLWESLFIAYTSLGYLIWLIRLALLSRRPLSPFIQGCARYLFWGNLTAFLAPLLAGVALIAADSALPLNYAIPFTLLFPLSMALATLLAQLAESKAQLIQSEKMAAVGSLLGGIAHELNNPLNHLSANLDLLKDYLSFLRQVPMVEGPRYKGRLAPNEVLAESSAIAEEMDVGTNRAVEMMQLLKKMGRAEEIPRECFAIRPVLAEALKFLAPRFPNLPGQCLSEIPPNATLELPRTLFLELLLNLLANAAAALPEGAGAGAIEVRFREEGAWSFLGVIDKGRGITSDLLPRIRDPFFTTQAPGAGSGLGLSLAERWVRGWGGQIEIESEAGQGTQVWVKIPR